MGPVITLIRLSPAPNHHNLSYLLIKSFFNTQCNLTLSPVHVWGLQGLSASFWGQTRGVGAPTLWYQLLQKWALSASCWSRWGSWLPLTGVGTASVPKNSYWEEPAWVKQARHAVPAAGTGHVPGARGVWRATVCILSKPGVHNYSWTRQQVGGAGPGMRYQVGGGSMLDKCVSAACLLVSIKLDQPVSRGPMGQVRRPAIWAGVLSGQRGRAGTWGIRKCMCLWTQIISCACLH